MQNQFGITCGLKQHAVFSKIIAKLFGVAEVAIMTNGQVPSLVMDPKRLDIGRVFRGSRGRISIVPNSRITLEHFIEHLLFFKDAQNKTKAIVAWHTWPLL